MAHGPPSSPLLTTHPISGSKERRSLVGSRGKALAYFPPLCFDNPRSKGWVHVGISIGHRGRQANRRTKPQGDLRRHYRQHHGVVRLRRFRLSGRLPGAEFLSQGRSAHLAAQHLPDFRRRPDFPAARRHRHRPAGRPPRPQAGPDPDHPDDGSRHGDHRHAADLFLDRCAGTDPAAARPPAAGVFHRRRVGRCDGVHGGVVGRGQARPVYQLPADVGGRRQPAGRRLVGAADLLDRGGCHQRLGLADSVPAGRAVRPDRALAAARGG